MYTYVHYENEKQIGKVRGRDVFLNKRTERYTQLNSKKIHPPPPLEHPSVETQQRRHLFQTHIHVQEHLQQTYTKPTDAKLYTDFLKEYEKPMPRSSTPNLHTCNNCSHYTSHCICAVSSNEPKGYVNWKHHFHTSPFVFRPVENIPDALSGNATSKPKIQLPSVPPKTPIRTTSLLLKKSAVIDRFAEMNRRDSISDIGTGNINAIDMIDDRKRNQQKLESEMIKVQMKFAYMRSWMYIFTEHEKLNALLKIQKGQQKRIDGIKYVPRS